MRNERSSNTRSPRTTVFRSVLATALAMACGCQGRLAATIAEQTEAGSGKLDLRAVPPADWDRVFLFGPYTPRNDICSSLGLAQDDCERGDFDDVGETSFLVVLMSGNTVSYQESVPRTLGDFEEECLRRAISRSSAELERRGSGFRCRGEGDSVLSGR
jgi:hypothetical protein